MVSQLTVTNMPILFPSVIRAQKVVDSDWVQMLKAILEERGFLQVSVLYEYIFFIFQIIKRTFDLSIQQISSNCRRISIGYWNFSGCLLWFMFT